MPHCPYCGGKIKDDEVFCVQCGKKLPEDLYDRMPTENTTFRFWYIPIVAIIILLISIGSFYLYLQNQTSKAREMFKLGEELALDGEFNEALVTFGDALQFKSNFPAATTMKDFLETAINIEVELTEANNYTEKSNYQDALSLINQAENKLANFNGEVVNLLVDGIVTQRKATQLQQLDEKIENNPSVQELKTLLWEAEAIKLDEANIIATDIRNQIVAYTSSNANEQLKKKQFSNARDIVEDGLKYAPDSEKLKSLKVTIDKEKTAFETAQEQRIEQAMSAAEEEREINKSDAVELVDIEILNDEQGNLVVSGKIKSVATVPINSISVDYILLDENDNELHSNEVYVYPETLYPDEEGNFDYTHFDIAEENKSLKVKIETIKWFLD